MLLRRASSCIIRTFVAACIGQSEVGFVPEVANVAESRLPATQSEQALVFFVDDTHEMGVHCRWN
jgi:hypothetical protein